MKNVMRVETNVRWIDEEVEECEVVCPECERDVTLRYGFLDHCPYCEARLFVTPEGVYLFK